MARYKIEEQIVSTGHTEVVRIDACAWIKGNGSPVNLGSLECEKLPEPVKVTIDVGVLNALAGNECPWECDVTRSCKQCIAEHLRLLSDNEA